MINNVVLIGRLTRDVELRYTPQNQAVGQFTLAVNRNFKTKMVNMMLTLSTVLFGASWPENFANWTKKGNLVSITGRVRLAIMKISKGSVCM